jgi:hypothetical protein
MTDYLSSKNNSYNVTNSAVNTVFNIRYWKYLKTSFYINNMNYIVFMGFYFALQAGLVGYQVNYYAEIDSTAWMITARTLGILISFNMVLMVLLVARKTLTFLRNTRIGQICLPFDRFTSLHKYIGFSILFLSVLHTFAHGADLCNFSFDSQFYLKVHFKEILFSIFQDYLSSDHLESHSAKSQNTRFNTTAQASLPFVELLFTTKSGYGWIYQLAMPTGWLILALMILVDIFSLSYFRKKGYFEVLTN